MDDLHLDAINRGRSVGVDFAATMGLEVRNMDLLRGSFMDVERDGGRPLRKLIDPGEVFTCQIAAGQATITFGPFLGCIFVDLSE